MKPKIKVISWLFIVLFYLNACGTDSTATEEASNREAQGSLDKANDVQYYCPAISKVEVSTKSELIKNTAFQQIQSVKAFRELSDKVLAIHIFIANTALNNNSAKEIFGHKFQEEEAVLTFVLHQYSQKEYMKPIENSHFVQESTNLQGEVFFLAAEGKKLTFDTASMEKQEFYITQINASEICGSFHLKDAQTEIKGEFIAPFMDVF